MRSSTFRAAAALALLPTELVLATTFNIVGRPRQSIDVPGLRRRAVDIGSFGNGSEVLDNGSDTIYSCNITLGGSEFEVLIDTGSSDLWVQGDVPGTKNLSISSTVSYASGSAQGFINTADLVFDDFTVSDQAYINVVTTQDNLGTQGIIGLGPSAESKVLSQLDNSNQNVNGAPPLDRIFQQNTSTPNYITVLLSRDSITGGAGVQSGQISVGSVLPSYEDITKQPKLSALKDQDGIQHWQTLLDANGIIGPDGNNITTKTTISNPTEGSANQFHVAFDTGFTFPQMTQDVADAIYGRVPGAKFVSQQSNPGYWQIPCDYELNVTFYFNNVAFPIHPLDLSMPESSNDDKNCMSTFQQIAPTTANHKEFGAFDIILGMAFLRNAYLLVDFGDFVDNSNSSVGDPYIQLLPLTSNSTAHSEFVSTRLGGVDTTGSQQALVSESDAQHSPAVSSDQQNFNDDDDSSSSKPWYKRWQIWAIAGGAAVGLMVLALLLSRCLRTRRSNVRKEAAFVPQMGAYARLRDSQVHARSYSQQPAPPYGGYEMPKYQYGYQYGSHQV